MSELSTHSVILNNVEKIPIKWNEELTFSDLYPGSFAITNLEISVLTLSGGAAMTVTTDD